MAIIFGGNVRLLKHQTNGGSIRQDAGSRAVHLGVVSGEQVSFGFSNSIIKGSSELYIYFASCFFFNQRLEGEKKCFCFLLAMTSTSSKDSLKVLKRSFSSSQNNIKTTILVIFHVSGKLLKKVCLKNWAQLRCRTILYNHPWCQRSAEQASVDDSETQEETLERSIMVNLFYQCSSNGLFIMVHLMSIMMVNHSSSFFIQFFKHPVLAGRPYFVA